MLREHERLLQIGRSAQGEISGNLRVGIIPTLAPYLLPLFLGTFASEYPKVRLTIDEIKTDEIVKDLAADVLDAGILATPLHETGLHERVLFYEPFYLYVSDTSPLFQRKRIRDTDLDGSELWLLQDGHCLKNQVANYCSIARELGNTVLQNVRFEGGNLETLRYLIRRGRRGYTLLPHLFVANLPDDERAAAVKPFAGRVPTREVSLVHRRDHWKADIIGALEAVIKAALPAELLKLDKTKLEVLAIEPTPA